MSFLPLIGLMRETEHVAICRPLRERLFDSEQKRCPHATDHRNPCTESNEPGQLGSRYATQAIEARRATTGTGVVHESAVAEGHAPETPIKEPNHDQR